MAVATIKCEFPRRQAMLSISDNEEQSGGERMRYISLFSGIEAASVAWESLGWKPMAFAEVDEFPSAVLAHRFPNVPNLGDVTKVDWKEFVRKHGKPDVVVGGSPCQSFSVAGGRESLDGESRLMFEYIRALREIRPKWFLWENVPGVLNTRDDAFAQLLGEVQDIGYVSVAWRVLDAQFFGVAQRRRRVFLVGRLGDGGGAAAVLFESESVSGNTQTGKQKREELARATGRGSNAGGGEGVASGFCGYASHTASSIGYQEEQSPTLKGNDWQCQVPDVLQAIASQTGHTKSNGLGVNVDGVSYTVSTATDQAVAFAQNTRDEVRLQGDGTISGALSAQPGMKQTTYVAQRMAATQYGEEVAGTLTARHDSSPRADRGQNIVCMASGQSNAEVTSDVTSPTITCLHEKPIVCMPHSYVLKVRQGKPGGGKGALVGTEVSFTLATSQDQTLFATAGDATADAMAVTIHDGSRWVVRRLTPMECERLQGFPDGWTDVPFKGREHPGDTPRYKAIGNSMAVPVMRWIGERIQMADKMEVGA